MTGNNIRQHLHSGKRVYGTHIFSFVNPVAAALTADLDLDFAFFCTEHVPLSRTEVSMLCQYFRARGISPIVRVPNADSTGITMALDGGAEGIVVPYVETVEEVRRASGAVHLRPVKGSLLRNALNGRDQLPGKTSAFVEDFNRSRYLIIGIESQAAIDNLDALIDVEGVDGVFLGPHDITTTMGIPTEYRNPAFIDVIEDVVRRCRQRGIGVGLHTMLLRMEERDLRRLLDAGMNWLLNGSDMSVMRDAMAMQLRHLREMTQDVIDEKVVAGSGVTIPACVG